MRTLLCGIIATAALLHGQVAHPPSTATFVVAGRIVTSSGADLRPVRYARVVLTGNSLGIARTTETDTKGSYRFDHLVPANYHVSVQKPGFVKLDADATPDLTLTMLRGGAIEGVVADADGDPVMNVAVSALRQQIDGAKPSLVAQTRTDDLGRYRLYSLESGEYLVQAATDRSFLQNVSLAPGQKMPETTNAYYPSAASIENAVAVHLDAGREVTSIDVMLTPNPPINDPSGKPARPEEEPKGTGRIAGRITDATSGKPIKGARLLLLPTEGIRITNWTSSDARGRFEYTGLAARKYTLQVGAERYITLEYGRTRPGETGVPIDVSDDQDTRVDMSLPRTTAIEGTLVDDFGDPAPGFAVLVARKTYAGGRKRLVAVGGRIQPLPSDDRGHYRVFGLDPSQYFVAAFPVDSSDPSAVSGFGLTYYPGATDAANAMLVTVAPGADNSVVSFPVSRPQTYTVTGTMVSADGTPVSGRGTLWVVTPDHLHRLDMNMARSATTPDGQFVLRDVPAGQYTLQGFGPPSPGYSGPMNLAAMPFGWTPLAIQDSDLDGVVLKVTDGTTLRGKFVKDDDDGPPLTPQQLHVNTVPIEFDSAFAGGGPSPSETHEDWTFEVTHQTGRRRILVSVSSPLWTVKTITHDNVDITDQALDFGEKDVDGVEITLTSKVSDLTGDVSDGTRRVQDYAVIIFSSDPSKWIDRSRFVTLARSAQQGRFEVRSLPPDDYLAVALPNVNGTEWMDPDFLQSVASLATAFSLQEGESKVLALKIKTAPDYRLPNPL